MAERNHYLCRVHLDGATLYLLWYSGDTDGLLRDADGRMIAFATHEVATDYAMTAGIRVDANSVAAYDFDAIAAWCREPSAERIACSRFLDAWNFLADALQGADDNHRFRHAERVAVAVYETLFWGCNLPSVTPAGESFEPTWTATAVEHLRAVLDAGAAALHIAFGKSHAV